MSRNQFKAYQNGLFELLDIVSPYFILNLAWLIFSLPVVTLIPATGALYYSTNVLVREGDATLGDFWQGFKSYFKLSWLWGAINVLAYGLIASNFWFYSNIEAVWTSWVMAAILIILLFWTCLQLYTFPLLIEQDDKRIRVALRNSYVMFILRPFRTLGWTLLVLTIAALSTLYALPSWMIITATVCLYISNRATRMALDVLRPESEDDDGVA